MNSGRPAQAAGAVPRRPSAPRARPNRTRAVAATVAVAAAVVGLLAVTGHLPGRSRATQVPQVAAPWEFQATAWQTLGGDQKLTRARYAELASWADPHLTAADRDALVRLATQAETADLTGEGRAAFAGYWPPASRTGVPTSTRCSSVKILVVSPARLPTTSDNAATSDASSFPSAAGAARYAKTLVAYAGVCGTRRYTTADPGVDYVYAAKTAHGWQARRDWQLPAPPPPKTDPQAATEPAEWELKRFGSCGAPDQVLRDRIVVVDAFTRMCRDAAADGVTLTVESAFRTRAEQASLFASAVHDYGSVEEARKWVAYADDRVCESRHCSGMALDVEATSTAMKWLTRTAGCLDGQQAAAASSCPAGQTPVPQMARYGFAAPLPQVPGYLEFTLPVPGDDDSTLSSPNCSPSGVPVPNMVSSVFRCRLERAGVTGAEQDKVVAEALVVSRCESGWNAAARAYGGRFAASPNPADGSVYTETGVFMLSKDLAAAGWVAGGTEGLTDPVANINAAASLWLATRGWEQFGCATGTDGGFEAGPVLPAYGGPALPSWASAY